MTERDPGEVTSLNADGAPEELGEGDLEEAAGGCKSFSCTLYNIFGNAADEPTTGAET